MLRYARKRPARSALIILAMAAYGLLGAALPGPRPDMNQHNGGGSKLPILFEPNVGQAGESVCYLAHAPGANLFFAPSEVVLSLDTRDTATTPIDRGRRGPGLAAPDAGAIRSESVVRLRFLDANPAPAMEHDAPAPGKV
ncbi:MAG: hypothetical protein WCD37_07710, partial [Chloroflexia bacterium]